MLSDNDRDGDSKGGKPRVTRTTSEDHQPGPLARKQASPGGVIPTGASSILGKKTPATLAGDGDKQTQEVS